jgi:hypothetical protein
VHEVHELPSVLEQLVIQCVGSGEHAVHTSFSHVAAVVPLHVALEQAKEDIGIIQIEMIMVAMAYRLVVTMFINILPKLITLLVTAAR